MLYSESFYCPILPVCRLYQNIFRKEIEKLPSELWFYSCPIMMLKAFVRNTATLLLSATKKAVCVNRFRLVLVCLFNRRTRKEDNFYSKEGTELVLLQPSLSFTFLREQSFLMIQNFLPTLYSSCWALVRVKRYRKKTVTFP